MLGPWSPSRARLWSCDGRQRDDGAARDQGQDAQFLPVEPLFDDDLPPRRPAELLAHHDALDGRQRLLVGVADDDALARGQTVRLDDDRIFARLHVVAGRVGMVEDAKLRRRHVGVAHQLLGEHLARFELGGGLGRAEDLQACLLKRIDDAVRQRLFRADDGQADVFFLGELDQAIDVVHRESAR